MENNILSKQKLAATLWEAANKLRGGLEANEYKDYILGLIFYKYLSQKQIDFMLSEGIDENDLECFTKDYEQRTIDFSDSSINDKEEITELIQRIKKELGYYIHYENLYQVWTNPQWKSINVFTVKTLTDAIEEFNRSLSNNSRQLYGNIFGVFENDMSKYSTNLTEQSKMLANLIDIIQRIPFHHGKYDVLGFVYEYLIAQFAAGAGKKGGEFYTPHEVSLLMAKIVAYHLRDRETIKVYDPTSGSGSLLLTISDAFRKYNKSKSPIKFFAQEKIRQTFNITRMNLVMKGINPADISVRCGDTLEQDWPFFNDDDITSYKYESVDAVVSNPPYSLNWDNENKTNDPRYKEYGIAPKSKGDYAFLLHDLYHLKNDGILTIVLPHGVLFRGGSEKQIRSKLIEKGQIDAIIGLPSNIFYGTGISTIIMVLKKQKDTRDIQFIDASKLFVKGVKKNRLEAMHIKKIADVVNNRLEIEGFSRIVSFEEIKNNDFNLNISRYLDNYEKSETNDLYSLMYGGISHDELKQFDKFFACFPELKSKLLKANNNNYFDIISNDDSQIRDLIINDQTVNIYKAKYDQISAQINWLFNSTFNSLSSMQNVNAEAFEDKLVELVFEQSSSLDLVDKYLFYQVIKNNFENIKNGLDLLSNFDQNNSITSILDEIIDKEYAGKKRKKLKDFNAQLFNKNDIAQSYYATQLELLEQYSVQNEQLNNQINELVESIPEEERVDQLFKEKDNSLDAEELEKYVKALNASTYDEDSFEHKVIQINKLIEQRASLTKQQNELNSKITQDSLNKIYNLSENEFVSLIINKWTTQIGNEINKIANVIIEDYVSKFEHLEAKYKDTFNNIDEQIVENEKELITLLNDLTGDESDMKAIDELIKVLGGK
ncbi:type I restriction-modification system subunit M [Mycoplasmopsis mucosicanis]|uniref:site-specific DNA-methyltransferase (adenine-specific) n=1 Tax=Mycoplasmopsis mucosicanis TaxID=458208 RepID=A0A507SUS9_9BACT|nr:type I restriction-modification system subunit M [Mycoplasmopsis mucosicanis]TQC53944.1 type I restriction-modification system subunit M [Mycoplasmopsis mucosicanis]